MDPTLGATLLVKWILAVGVGGTMALLTLYAMLERNIEAWQGVLGMLVALVLTVGAVSLADTGWYLPILGLIFCILLGAYGLFVIETKIREWRMIEEDEARYREAIEFDAKNAAAHAFLARVLRKQRRLREAAAEYETALELDKQDSQSRWELQALIEEMREVPPEPVCPRCESPLDASGKTCPQCEWSRSTVKGLRDMYAAGGIRDALIYGVLGSIAVGVMSAIFGLSMELVLTLLLLLWLLGGVLLARWIARDLF